MFKLPNTIIISFNFTYFDESNDCKFAYESKLINEQNT